MATPLYDQILTQAGGRTPGSPVARPTSGGRSMQPSIPSYPSPPSSTVGVTGRPSSRPVVPGVVQAPQAPTAPVSSPAGPTASGTPSGGMPQPPGIDPVQRVPVPSTPITGPGPEAPPEAPRQPPPPPVDPMTQPMRVGGGGGSAALNGVTQQPTLNLPRVPSRRDYVGLLPGMGIGTPYGPATVGADGDPIIQFPTPEHEARYRQDETQYAARYGANPISQFPGAPQPNIRLGRPAFNPFQGTWLTPNQ
jgi:hypothetical protein